MYSEPEQVEINIKIEKEDSFAEDTTDSEPEENVNIKIEYNDSESEEVIKRFKSENEFEDRNNEILRKFIEKYKSLPILWDRSLPAYMNKEKRNIALAKLLKIYHKIKPDANHYDVRRKINTLRCNFRKELRKMSTQAVYQPTSWVFHALKFLDFSQQPPNSNAHTMIPHDDGRQGVSEEHSEEQYPTSVSPVQSRSSSLPPPPKKQCVVGPILEQKELLSMTCKYHGSSREPQENIPNIAKAWGEKLLTLEPRQRLFAEKAINDILFEASQGFLDRHSVKINEDPIRTPQSSASSSANVHTTYFSPSLEECMKNKFI